LTRPEHLEQIGIALAEMNEALEAMAAIGEPVIDDEMVLETAVNGGADWLAAFNLRHLGLVARTFGIPAMRPGALWREIRGVPL
jgi:hypothetical protein